MIEITKKKRNYRLKPFIILDRPEIVRNGHLYIRKISFRKITFNSLNINYTFNIENNWINNIIASKNISRELWYLFARSTTKETRTTSCKKSLWLFSRLRRGKSYERQKQNIMGKLFAMLLREESKRAPLSSENS